MQQRDQAIDRGKRYPIPKLQESAVRDKLSAALLSCVRQLTLPAVASPGMHPEIILIDGDPGSEL
jgi:hypothetical protein